MRDRCDKAVRGQVARLAWGLRRFLRDEAFDGVCEMTAAERRAYVRDFVADELEALCGPSKVIQGSSH
jgi:hypothetical protein